MVGMKTVLPICWNAAARRLKILVRLLMLIRSWQTSKHAPQFLRADVVFALRYEVSLHLEDVLVRRVRLDLEQRDRGLAAAPEILEIMRSELNWDDAKVARTGTLHRTGESYSRGRVHFYRC